MAESSAPVSFNVKDKTAIITGAGSGINLAFAKLLLSRGCNVVIADIALRPESQEVIDAYTGDDGNASAVFVKTDVTKWDQLSNAFDFAEREFDGVDIVCPGAGVFEPHWSNFWHPPGTSVSKDPVHGSDGVGHYATLDINLMHPIRATQIAIARWLTPPPNSRSGKVSLSNPKRVMHISSIAAQAPVFSAPLYAASKAAVSSFIRSLAPLDTLGIRVNGVAPGIIKTPLWTDHPEKLPMVDEEQDTWILPEEVAEALLRCCEDDEVVGGYVMEITKGARRNVQAIMDPGPQSEGASVSRMDLAVKEVFQWLAEDGWGASPNLSL